MSQHHMSELRKVLACRDPAVAAAVTALYHEIARLDERVDVLEATVASRADTTVAPAQPFRTVALVETNTVPKPSESDIDVLREVEVPATVDPPPACALAAVAVAPDESDSGEDSSGSGGEPVEQAEVAPPKPAPPAAPSAADVLESLEDNVEPLDPKEAEQRDLLRKGKSVDWSKTLARSQVRAVTDALKKLELYLAGDKRAPTASAADALAEVVRTHLDIANKSTQRAQVVRTQQAALRASTVAKKVTATSGKA